MVHSMATAKKGGRGLVHGHDKGYGDTSNTNVKLEKEKAMAAEL